MQITHDGAVAPAAARVVAGLAPEIAMGRACAHLMARPAFAGAPFGHLARCLAGQINRGHYAFAMEGARTVGFAGWARTSAGSAEAWLAGTRGFADAEAAQGDCLVLNFWQADRPEISRILIRHLTAAAPGVRRLYARRHYADGRIRPVRLDVAARALSQTLRPEEERSAVPAGA